jgi:hypothetical protein
MMRWLERAIQGRFSQSRRRDGFARLAVVLVTLALVQAALLGESLTGGRIMLPLKLLKVQNPAILTLLGPEEAQPKASMTGLDLVLQFEPFRKYVVEEYRAGRIPLWNRYSYSGSPFVANGQSAVMSPYRLVDVAMNDPMSTAWAQMLKCLIAGLGMYLFLRIAMRVRFLPALVGAHLFAMCGFMLYFCGHPHTQAASWLPWVMLGCDRLVRRPGPGWLALTAGSAAASFYSGHPQTTAHVYLCAGIWVAAMLLHTAWRKPWKVTAVRVGWLAAAGVFAGLLVGPQLMPTLEYLPWSLRLENRAAGRSAVPVSGLPGLMEMVMPYFNGSSLHKTKFFGIVNHAESMASGSVGLVWALFFAPLGVYMARRDARGWVLLFLLVFGLCKPLGVPGISVIYDHGPLGMLSANRLVLLAAVAVIVLGAVGLDRLIRGRRVGWMVAAACAVPAAVVLGVALYWMVVANNMALNPEADELMVGTANWFVQAFALAGMMLLAMLVGFGIVVKTPRLAGRVAVGLACLAMLEGTVLAWGMYPSEPRSEYYPKLAAMEWAAQKTGIEYRACGYKAFPANLNLMYNIPDPRGYDALDPIPMVRLMELFRTQGPKLDPDYANVLVWTPRRSGLSAMLAIKYLIIRGGVPEGMKPAFVDQGYWVMEVPDTLPRVFVPTGVKTIVGLEERLAALADPSFLPGKTVIVEAAVPGVPDGQAVAGEAKMVSDTGGEIVFKAKMETAGVVVLADLWYPGWKATVDGKETEILRVNTTLKGVVLGAGQHEVKLVYWPWSFVKGLWMFFAGVVGLVGVWVVFEVRSKK